MFHVIQEMIEDRGYIFFNIAITSFHFLSWRFSLLFLYQLYQEHLYFLLKYKESRHKLDC